MPKLPLDFYLRDTIEVARDLLGKTLVHQFANGTQLSGKIVETEAYLGGDDPACHSYNLRCTPRTSPMFKRGGISYIYFIYGMYYCFNVVTGEENAPEAVLVRALEPLEGVEVMRRLRPLSKNDFGLTSGPGKLCQAMGLTQAQNGLSLLKEPLFILDNPPVREEEIEDSARIGLGNRHDAVHWPLRFYLRDNPFVS